MTPRSWDSLKNLTNGDISAPLGMWQEALQLVYDLDEWIDESVIDDIMTAETGLCFGPDTLAEARNRGYTLAASGMTRRHRKPRA